MIITVLTGALVSWFKDILYYSYDDNCISLLCFRLTIPNATFEKNNEPMINKEKKIYMNLNISMPNHMHV